MTALPDPAELAPSRDPAVYGRRRILTPAFWAMLGLSFVCVLAGMAIVILAPRLLHARLAPAPAAPSAAAPNTPQVPFPTPGSSATLPGSAIAPAPGADIASLEARTARLESDQGRMLDAAGGALAAAALSQAAQGPAPFATELAAYQRALPGSLAAPALAPLAAQGAPTRAALAERLADIAAEITAAARTPGRGASLASQLLYAISKVVTVRRIDGAGGGADAALARALRRAQEGDLEGALAILDTLPPAAQAPLRAWREAALRRIAIDKEVEALRAEALADLELARLGR
jgi:hypothetical protein